MGCLNCGKKLNVTQKKYCGHSCKCKHNNPMWQPSVVDNNAGVFRKGHKHSENALKKMSDSWFKKGHKINLGRERPDMIGNKLNPFPKGHLFNYKNGISKYREYIEKYECFHCGKKAEIINKGLGQHKERINLDIHHVDGDKENNIVKNLIVLCRKCHMQTHKFERLF